MSTFHHTDQLGQAVTGAVTAVQEALGQLEDLEGQLTDERESHRAEVMRLVERAEAAEIASDQAERAAGENWAQLVQVRAELDTERATVELLREQRVQLEVQVATSEERAAGWNAQAAEKDAVIERYQERAHSAEARTAELERLVATLRSDYAELRQAHAELEDGASSLRATTLRLRQALADAAARES